MSYDILPFSDENLAIALSNKIAPENIKSRAHYLYLKNYLGSSGIDAKTIVLEHEYVSKAYITDYSTYYATCFKEYERFCKRAHFFSNAFSEEEFEKEIFECNSNVLQENYLGYVVVKPLPDSVIGPTILATYKEKDNGHKRYFPACRDYEVNLFGKTLTIKSLAFQEQDNIVYACASVAIWSAFHKTSQLFRTELPSPGEITASAGNLFINVGRNYPNRGLDITQICRAIDAIGLVSEMRATGEFHKHIKIANRIIYSYLKAGIPIILNMTSDVDENEDGHAVTITGYSEPKPKKEDPRDKITLVADRIESFYVHDDQMGPFAKYNFSGGTALLVTQRDSEGNENSQSRWIQSLVIPVYSKIRIRYEDVFASVVEFDRIIYEMDIFNLELEWDIYLQESNEYKRELRKAYLGPYQKMKNKLTTNFPRYIWVARAKMEEVNLFDIIYDSTDIATGAFCNNFVLHDLYLAPLLIETLNTHKEIFIDGSNLPGFGANTYDLILNECFEKAF